MYEGILLHELRTEYNMQNDLFARSSTRSEEPQSSDIT